MLIAAVSEETGVSREVVQTVLYAYFRLVVDTLVGGRCIRVRGFGSFLIGWRAGHIGRNPRTGEAVPVPAHRVLKFVPGKALRGRLAGVVPDDRG